MARKPASSHASSGALLRIGVVFFASTCALLAVNQYNSRAAGLAAAAQLRSGVQQQQQQPRQQKQQEQHDAAEAVAAPHQASKLPAQQQLQLSNVTLKYFPQARRCRLDGWAQQYASLHQHILSGAAAPRYLVSLTPGTGLADKLVGTVTLLWHAVLTQRALTVTHYPGDPSLSDVCKAPLFDWTQTQVPAVVKQDAVDALRPADLKNDFLPLFAKLPATYAPNSFAAMYLHNKNKPSKKVYNSSLSSLVKPDPAYLLMTTNRGRTYQLAAQNPHHKQQFQKMGVAPVDAFMCGFFAFCSPVAAIQQYYQRFWDVLQEPGVLRIGIQVRAGDKAMAASSAGSNNGAPSAKQQRPPQEVLKWASYFFKCAERLEAAYASPGQKVVWFLNSDSQAIRQAAQEVYGSKVLTDDSLHMVHPECSRHGSSKQACEAGTLKWALQHSLGSVLTFSMTDLQVISQRSGFGRAGAWLADRRDGIYELQGSATWSSECVPKLPTDPAVSSAHWSGI